MNVPLYQHMELKDKEYQLLADLIYKKSGISLGDNKKELVRTRFQKLIRQLGLKSFKEYYEYVVNDKSGSELVRMIDAISTNHTFFFREKDHFDFFSSQGLPDIVKKKAAAGNRKIRIWCAAASSGEEPYTIIICILEAMDTYGWDIKMLATDISTKVLAKAVEGRYRSNQLKEMSPLLISKYFDREDVAGEKLYRVKPELKSFITYRRFNLMRPQFPFKGKFDFIFCRNVMIYFDPPTQQNLVQKLLNFLDMGGYLFIGHSETLTGAVKNRVRTVGPALFQKVA